MDLSKLSNEELLKLKTKFAGEVSKKTCGTSSSESSVQVANSAPIKKERKEEVYDFNKLDFSVKNIDKKLTYEWFLNKHYAHRIPAIIIYSYGLYNKNNILQGVCTFGMSANNSLNNLLGNYRCIELNRLIVNELLPKNTLSFFVSSCLKLLPQPITVISYSDSGQGHHGYIYQALNWLYTGMGCGDIEFRKDGKMYHRKVIFNRLGTGSIENAIKNGYEPIKVTPKHRYLMFLGNYKQKKEMRAALKWKILPYPKGDNINYDASYEIKGLNINKKGKAQ